MDVYTNTPLCLGIEGYSEPKDCLVLSDQQEMEREREREDNYAASLELEFEEEMELEKGREEIVDEGREEAGYDVVGKTVLNIRFVK